MTDQQDQNPGTDHSLAAGTRPSANTGTRKANGRGNGHSAPFDDFDNPFAEERDSDDWRSDVPTEAETKVGPTSIFDPRKLRAMVKLRDTNRRDYVVLRRQLAGVANHPDVTPDKIDKAVMAEASKMQREA